MGERNFLGALLSRGPKRGELTLAIVRGEWLPKAIPLGWRFASGARRGANVEGSEVRYEERRRPAQARTIRWLGVRGERRMFGTGMVHVSIGQSNQPVIPVRR
jgi:hypothetical protein